MKKIFAISVITALSVFVTAAAFADEGEEELSNVAPAIIQAPPELTNVAQTAPAQQPQAAISKPAAPARQNITPLVRRTISETTLRTADEQFVTGSVREIMPSSLMQPRARITIADTSGKETEFTVKTLAVIYDPTGAIMSLDKLQEGTKVQVNYRAGPGGVNEATSIKVLR
jgi:hypothetical protein